jgi:hypothetical protein
MSWSNASYGPSLDEVEGIVKTTESEIVELTVKITAIRRGTSQPEWVGVEYQRIMEDQLAHSVWLLGRFRELLAAT